jgi:hypothetical protein
MEMLLKTVSPNITLLVSKQFPMFLEICEICKFS